QQKGNHQLLDDFMASTEFQTLLSAIGWDDAYDRYQEMPQYDSTLARQYHEQLKADIVSGKVQIPTGKPHTSKDYIGQDDDISLDTLVKLTKDKVT
ncbi:MAG: hypothetical protein Q9P01_08000, partial [Anaerolineae bacterium]|nr:hypothetical protein [Anaerolineae bacterium]